MWWNSFGITRTSTKFPSNDNFVTYIRKMSCFHVDRVAYIVAFIWYIVYICLEFTLWAMIQIQDEGKNNEAIWSQLLRNNVLGKSKLDGVNYDSCAMWHGTLETFNAMQGKNNYNPLTLPYREIYVFLYSMNFFLLAMACSLLLADPTMTTGNGVFLAALPSIHGIILWCYHWVRKQGGKKFY